MKVYLNKRHLKAVLIAIITAIVLLALLKMVSLWDEKQSVVHIENDQETVALFDDETENPSDFIQEDNLEDNE